MTVSGKSAAYKKCRKQFSLFFTRFFAEVRRGWQAFDRLAPCLPGLAVDRFLGDLSSRTVPQFDGDDF
jgi:hypothetical protein